MRKRFLLGVSIAILVVLTTNYARAQNNSAVDVKKFEAGGDFSTITFDSEQTQLGLGGRLTYNFNKHLAFEAAGYYFPNNCVFCGRNAGRTSEGLFGVKIGQRFQKWGLFGKVRPGVLSSSKGRSDIVLNVPPGSPPGLNPLSLVQTRATYFALDVGAVVEFYPTKRIITRLDFGGTGIRYGEHSTHIPVFDPVTGTFSLTTTTVPAQNKAQLQIMAGLGFRF